MTDDGVEKLARSLRYLETLSLNHTRVTDVGMAHVAEGLSKLTTLYLIDANVTDKGLASLAAGLTKLTTHYRPHGLPTGDRPGCGEGGGRVFWIPD